MENYASDTFEIAAALFDREGEITQISRTHGVDFGRPIEILVKDGKFAVARRTGHLTFAGIGSQRWESTTYYLLQIWPDDSRILFKILEKQKPGYGHKKAVKELSAKMKKLAEGK